MNCLRFMMNLWKIFIRNLMPNANEFKLLDICMTIFSINTLGM